jgi:hypothetical protein
MDHTGDVENKKQRKFGDLGGNETPSETNIQGKNNKLPI